MRDLKKVLPEFIESPTCCIKAGGWTICIIDGVVTRAKHGGVCIVSPGFVYDMGGRLDY